MSREFTEKYIKEFRFEGLGEMMGFLDNLKKDKVPEELPDLAMDSPKIPTTQVPQIPANPRPQEIPAVVTPRPQPIREPEEHKHLTFQMPEELKDLPMGDDSSKEEKSEEGGIPEEMSKDSYFNQILEDINGEIADIGNLEDWYEKKFLPQDVISNMRGYWEGNKTEMIIKGFGSDYKKKVNEKIAKLQGLEMDWREIYFKLVKKEEEMKKQEKELKETLSEFVELCKGRRSLDEEEKKKD